MWMVTNSISDGVCLPLFTFESRNGRCCSKRVKSCDCDGDVEMWADKDPKYACKGVTVFIAEEQIVAIKTLQNHLTLTRSYKMVMDR